MRLGVEVRAKLQDGSDEIDSNQVAKAITDPFTIEVGRYEDASVDASAG